MNSMNIKNKVAIITGGSSGIGKSIAYTLVVAGLRVTIIARKKKKLDLIVSELEEQGHSVFPIVADIANESELIESIKNSHNYWGATDILINNAACCIPTSFHFGNIKEWKYMSQLNIIAPCVAIQESLKYFNKEEGGHIINISSTSAYRIAKGGSFYSVTKFAIRAISETLRKELIEFKSKTKVSSISPGFVNTRFAQGEDFVIPNNLSKEKLDPDDIAQTVLFILKTPAHVSIQDIILRTTQQYD